MDKRIKACGGIPSGMHRSVENAATHAQRHVIARHEATVRDASLSGCGATFGALRSTERYSLTGMRCLTPFGMTPRAVWVKRRSAAAQPPLNAPPLFRRAHPSFRAKRETSWIALSLCTAGFATRQGNSTVRSSAGLQIRQDGQDGNGFALYLFIILSLYLFISRKSRKIKKESKKFSNTFENELSLRFQIKIDMIHTGHL